MWNKKTTQIAAFIALIAIFGSVIWTWVLVIFETLSGSKQAQKTLSQEQINELLQTYSWTLNNSGIMNQNTWITSSQSWISNIFTWTTK